MYGVERREEEGGGEKSGTAYETRAYKDKTHAEHTAGSIPLLVPDCPLDRWMMRRDKELDWCVRLRGEGGEA